MNKSVLRGYILRDAFPSVGRNDSQSVTCVKRTFLCHNIAICPSGKNRSLILRLKNIYKCYIH